MGVNPLRPHCSQRLIGALRARASIWHLAKAEDSLSSVNGLSGFCLRS